MQEVFLSETFQFNKLDKKGRF